MEYNWAKLRKNLIQYIKYLFPHLPQNKAASRWAVRPLSRGPCPQCAVCHPWEGLYARSVTMPIWNQRACNSGRGRHPWRTGPCLCMLHKNPLPSMVPPTLTDSPSLTLTKPFPNPTPPSRSLRAGCFSSSLSEVCMAEQWAFYPHETWNVSECSRLGPSLLSEHALCPLFLPRERDRDSERHSRHRRRE